MSAMYRFDDQSNRMVRDIKERHGVSSESEVIRRAIALLSVADKYALMDDGVVTFKLPKDSGEKRVRLYQTGR